MYSGTTIHGKSGHALGVHQRIDRLARRSLTSRAIGREQFPSAREILHFEGNNGPDGIKRKSPSVDEPWHFVDPSDPKDDELYRHIEAHHHNLVDALRAGERERASFEAAWLAHAIVDGLTPAHHYPLSDKVEQLWGKPKESRQSVKEKFYIKGDGRRDTLSRNWEYWGAKGVFTTHVLFEWGIGMAISTHRFGDMDISQERIGALATDGYRVQFEDAVHRIYDLNMYEEFWKNGWTRHLAKHTRVTLIPLIVQLVALAWYDAYQEAQA